MPDINNKLKVQRDTGQREKGITEEPEKTFIRALSLPGAIGAYPQNYRLIKVRRIKADATH